VVGAGNALALLRDSGKTDQEILNYAIEQEAVFSRVDLAVTEWIEETLVTVDEVENWYQKGLITSSLVKHGGKMFNGYDEELERQAETFYVGNLKRRADFGLFRAYDKGIEFEIEKYLVTRLEYEDRGEKAHSTAIRIAKTGDISGNFRARFDVAHDEFNRLMDADAVVIKRGLGKEKREDEAKMDARWQWLMTQVAPALNEARAWDLENKPESKRFYWFLRESGMTHEQIKRMVAEIREMWETKD
jgi:DNA relaxase NicK